MIAAWRVASRKLGNYWPNLLCVLGMLAYWYIWYMEAPFFFPSESSSAIWAMSVLAVLVIAPYRWWRFMLLAWFCLGGLLLYVNQEKMLLMSFPLTEQDLGIALRNPTGFLDAIGISRNGQVLVWLGAGSSLLAGGYFMLRRLCHPEQGFQHTRMVVRLGLASLSGVLFSGFYVDYGEHVYVNRDRIMGAGTEWWKPDVLVQTSNRLATLGFIAYSNAESRRRPTLLSFADNVRPTPAFEQAVVASAEKRLSGPARNRSDLAPNIVFVLAESTFDPQAAFQMEGGSGNLFAVEEGRPSGLLHVTPVGGGTWRTEFETITGLDSRLFGAMGEYTHLSLSPFVRDSFARHLMRQGYATHAYYPVSGTFYNARNAYANYGFEHFQDGPALGLTYDWAKFSDEEMAIHVAEAFPEEKDRPFFGYVVLLENHSPHRCSEAAMRKTQVRFSNESNEEKNCFLREYIRRTESTARGFEHLVQRLKAIERRTGRPYLIAIFGDHQPNTFTKAAYSANRTALSPHYTFFKVAMSPQLVLPEVRGTFHATLLPTWVSTLLARRGEEVFLPENLYLLEHCGDMADPAVCAPLTQMVPVYKRYIDL